VIVQSTPLGELVYLDASGSRAVLTVHFPISTTVTAALSAISALGAVVASISDAVLVEARITYKARITDPATPDVGASLKRRGMFFLVTSDSTPDAIVEIPAITDSVLVTTGPTAGYEIDASNVDVAIFLSALIDTPACNPFGDVSTELDAAYIQSRV